MVLVLELGLGRAERFGEGFWGLGLGSNGVGVAHRSEA